MSCDDVDDQIRRIEQAERAREDIWAAALRAMRDGPLADRFGGSWKDLARGRLVIAITGDPADAQRLLAPEARDLVEIRRVRYSLRELDALAIEIETDAQRAHLALWYASADPIDNLVEVNIDPDQPRAAAFMTSHQQAPIRWVHEPVDAVDGLRRRPRV
jgi:hypothetical protein